MYHAGRLRRALSVIQIDEENCFGRREWASIRRAICNDYLGMGAWTAWKHAQHSYVNQPANVTTEKDRGGEQGDTQGPLEACADLAGARGALHRPCKAVCRWTAMVHGVGRSHRSGTADWISDGFS
eukprot:3181924-Lingulodinium_polyedra.AAC.1